MLFFKKHNSRGFTLLEILLVIGIIAILAGIVIIAINPSKQLATVRNTQRKSDIKQLANAITQFYIDKSYYPASTTFSITSLMTICPTGASTSPAAGFCTGMLNLSELVPTYITAIPNDPGTTTTAGYSAVLRNKQVVVSAPLAELGVTILVGVDPCSVGGVAVGTMCLDGTVYVTSTLRTTPSDAGIYVWGPAGVITGATDLSDGRNNITILKALSSNLSVYPAAQACENSTANGKDDWYLPAKNELNTLFSNRVAIGNFDTSGASGSYYWSSTENTNNAAYLQYFLNSSQYGSWKYLNGTIRCVRRP
jgi:prepilin-type N-terminal cleavage/methylation domain-containing protein